MQKHTLKNTYINTYSLYLGKSAMQSGENQSEKLLPGDVSISIKNIQDFTLNGYVHESGLITRLSKLFRDFELKEGDDIFYEIVSGPGGQVIEIEMPAHLDQF